MADITSTAFGCGGPAGSGIAADLTGQAGWLLVSLNAGTAPTWVVDTDFDDGFAVDLNSTDEQAVLYDASGIDSPDRGLPIGGYLNDMLIAIQFKLDSLKPIQPVYVQSDPEGTWFNQFYVYVNDSGALIIVESGDGGAAFSVAAGLSAGVVYDVAISRYNSAGVTVVYAVSINDTVYTPTTLYGSASNAQGWSVDSTGNQVATLGGTLTLFLWDPVLEVDYEESYTFDGRISRFEQQFIGAPFFTQADTNYTHTYYPCAAPSSDFWQDFRSTVEEAP